MPWVETDAEFIAKHGAWHEVSERGQRALLFADGSRLEYAPKGGGWQGIAPPPPDADGGRLLLRARRAFHAGKLGVCKRAFDKLRLCLQGATDKSGLVLRFTWDEQALGPAPADWSVYGDGKATLERIKELARPHHEAVAGIDRQIEAHPLSIAESEAADRSRVALAEQEERRRARAMAWAEVEWFSDEPLETKGD